MGSNKPCELACVADVNGEEKGARKRRGGRRERMFTAQREVTNRKFGAAKAMN